MIEFLCASESNNLWQLLMSGALGAILGAIFGSIFTGIVTFYINKYSDLEKLKTSKIDQVYLIIRDILYTFGDFDNLRQQFHLYSDRELHDKIKEYGTKIDADLTHAGFILKNYVGGLEKYPEFETAVKKINEYHKKRKELLNLAEKEQSLYEENRHKFYEQFDQIRSKIEDALLNVLSDIENNIKKPDLTFLICLL